MINGIKSEEVATYNKQEDVEFVRPSSACTNVELVMRVFGACSETAGSLLDEGRILGSEMAESQLFADAKELVTRSLEETIRRDGVLTEPAATKQYLSAKMADLPHEVFACVFLDNRHRVIAYEEMFRGTIDGASVYPREVVKAALGHNAAAVVFAHNHPSGVAEPSNADRSITRRLTDALALIDIRVLDHIIVAGNSHTSFAERGLI